MTQNKGIKDTDSSSDKNDAQSKKEVCQFHDNRLIDLKK